MDSPVFDDDHFDIGERGRGGFGVSAEEDEAALAGVLAIQHLHLSQQEVVPENGQTDASGGTSEAAGYSPTTTHVYSTTGGTRRAFGYLTGEERWFVGVQSIIRRKGMEEWRASSRSGGWDTCS